MGDGHLGLGFVCVALAAAANLLGGAVVTFRRWDDRVLRFAVALGAGFMLAAVLLKMLPESARLTRLAPGLVLGGYLLSLFSRARRARARAEALAKRSS